MTDKPPDNGRRQMGLPDRRQNTYDALEKHLDEHLTAIENQFSKWLKRGLIAFSIMGLVCTLALVGMTFAIREIQNQRYDNCVAQNERHDNTLAELKTAEDDAIAKHPELASQIKEGQAANEKIINAVAPRLDCSKIHKFDITPW
jgi:hypothetical protein